MTETRAYRDEEVRLADLAANDDVIAGVTFDNCTLVGPAVVLLIGGEMKDCVLEGPNDALFWPVGERNLVVGAIGLLDCALRSCRLRRIGIAYSPADEEMYRQEFGF